MKFLSVTLFVVVIAAIAVQGKKSKASWKAYKQAHGKNYDASTDALRESLFQKKAAEIEVHNSNPDNDFQRELNKFSDMTDDEKEAHLGINNPHSERFIQQLTVDLSNSVEDRQLPPASLDYRNNSCLGAVKNQRSCGSCWAFTAIAPLEFSYCLKYKTAIVLSEQQLVDCDTYDSGCNGGWYTNAWNYLKNIAKGSAKQSLYAYTAKKATACKFNNATMIAAKVSTYGYVQSKNATAMQVALQKFGPLSVAIAAVSPFFSYASGVFTDKACDTVNVNHGVVVVGWGTLNGVNYWVVRNSWGATWGQKGYILMQRGVNKCKIETYPAYVVAA